MGNFVREYERIDCPGCGRRISAYVPHFGDGTGLRTVRHNRRERAPRRPPPECPASGRILVRRDGKWAFDQ